MRGVGESEKDIQNPFEVLEMIDSQWLHSKQSRLDLKIDLHNVDLKLFLVIYSSYRKYKKEVHSQKYTERRLYTETSEDYAFHLAQCCVISVHYSLASILKRQNISSAIVKVRFLESQLFYFTWDSLNKMAFQDPFRSSSQFSHL